MVVKCPLDPRRGWRRPGDRGRAVPKLLIFLLKTTERKKRIGGSSHGRDTRGAVHSPTVSTRLPIDPSLHDGSLRHLERPRRHTNSLKSLRLKFSIPNKLPPHPHLNPFSKLWTILHPDPPPSPPLSPKVYENRHTTCHNRGRWFRRPPSKSIPTDRWGLKTSVYLSINHARGYVFVWTTFLDLPGEDKLTTEVLRP